MAVFFKIAINQQQQQPVSVVICILCGENHYGIHQHPQLKIPLINRFTIKTVYATLHVCTRNIIYIIFYTIIFYSQCFYCY
jgi:hypothetical protein